MKYRYTLCTLSDDTDDSDYLASDDKITDGEEDGSDVSSDDNSQDSAITDESIPPEERPRPEDLGLSTDKVAEQSAQIRHEQEMATSEDLQ